MKCNACDNESVYWLQALRQHLCVDCLPIDARAVHDALVAPPPDEEAPAIDVVAADAANADTEPPADNVDAADMGDVANHSDEPADDSGTVGGSDERETSVGG